MIDLTRYLDLKGAIAPERGPARKMADFLTAVVAYASDFDRSAFLAYVNGTRINAHDEANGITS